MTSDSKGELSRPGAAQNAPASDRERPPLPPRFSLVRSFTPADFITLLNAASGVSSVFASIEHAVSGERAYAAVAGVLVLVAALADFFDGRVARRATRSSGLGGDLDSLADLISFGVAPACLAYSLGMNGGWDWLVLVYFVCCGLSRLARYNVTASALSDESGKVRYFEGTPIPTSLFLVLVLGLLLATGRVREQLPWGALQLGPAVLHPLILLYLLSGSAMISARLRVPKP